MAAEWLCRGQMPLLVVDGENSFDPFIFANAARRVGLSPDRVLRHLFVSRAFTCHQLQALIVERLIPELRKTGSRIIIILGLLATFYDEQVPVWEAQRLLRPTLGRLLGLGKSGYALLLLLPGEPRAIPKRRQFLQWTKSCAERVLRVEEQRTDEDELYQVQVRLEKPAKATLQWEISFDPAMQPRPRWQGGWNR